MRATLWEKESEKVKKEVLEEKLNRKLQQRFGEQVRATVEGDIIRVTGHLQCREDILEACNMCVVKQPGVHVVNDVVLDGVEMPQLFKLTGQMQRLWG